MASYTELSIDQGTSYISIITIKDEDTNRPINIASFNVSSQIRHSYYSRCPTANFSCSTSDAANGNVIISMTANTTSNIAPGRYVFDIVLNNANNSIVIRPIEGIVTVSPGVTR